MEQALEVAQMIGRFPLIIRPAFTCGGTGGGIAYNVDEFKTMIQEGIDASMTNQVSVSSHVGGTQAIHDRSVVCSHLKHVNVCLHAL